MRQLTIEVEVLGPWSLRTSRSFWEGFSPAALEPRSQEDQIHTVFRAETDWSSVAADVKQAGARARIRLTGEGDLEEAAGQVSRFLSLDVDGRGWPAIAKSDPVIADAQRQLPGLRPCGFHSPYEAAAWAVLSQRTRIVQAARVREHLVQLHGDGGAFPAPQHLRTVDLDLPGRKTEYLHAVADAALEGRLDAQMLRGLDPDEALARVAEIKGLGPFAAELVVLRGANSTDVLPHHEQRLADEIAEQYGADKQLSEIAEAWRPYRTWAAVHLRTLREQRTHEITHPGQRHQRGG